MVSPTHDLQPTLRLQLLKDTPALQNLYEDCLDYFIFAEGTPPSPTAAADEFLNLPANVDPRAKFIFGYPASGALTAVLEGLRDYPQPGVWYIGLMLVKPQMRSFGLGTSVFTEFEALARQSGATEFRLCVFDTSPLALRFWQRNGFGFHRAVAAQQFGLRTHTRTELRKILVDT